MDFNSFILWASRVILVNKKLLTALLAIFVIFQLGFSIFISKPKTTDDTNYQNAVNIRQPQLNNLEIPKSIDKSFENVEKSNRINNEQEKPVVVDNAFLNKFAFDIKLNPDLKIPTDTYLSDYNKVQEKWSKLKKKSNPFKHQTGHQSRRQMISDTKNEYLILEYTKIGGHPRFCEFYEGPEANEEMARKKVYVEQCPHKNCRFTCDKAKANSAHVLLFHESDLYREMAAESNYMSKLQNAVTNRAAQIWLIWNDEANPVQSTIDAFQFNWTMSYRIDAEVSDCSYGCTYTKQKEQDDDEETFKSWIANEFKNRNTSALWFVSNCAPKLRLQFASSLSSYFRLKVYGSCASQISGFFSSLFLSSCGRFSDCEKAEFESNKFYLSFESKNCSSYTTEKFWRILSTNMIHVVLQPARKFYELVAPPNSFIHAQDFDYDPKKLADYLNKVASDIELYRKHLEWKKTMSAVYSQAQCERRRICELCSMLNKENTEIYYKSVSQWFNQDCIVN